MARIAYTVMATLPDEATAKAYIAWLEDGHVDAVVAGGAHSGMIVRLEGPAGGPVRVETRYVFATRHLYEHYLEHVAPALRAEGMRKFGPERGVKYERTLGEIL